jgi:glycosyltransferase involved in cell wall biosynthesis
VEVYTRNLARAMGKRHEVHVFYPLYTKGARKFQVNSYRDNENNIEIHELQIQENLWDECRRFLRFETVDLSSNDERIRKQFEECLEAIKPDVVHFQHLVGLSGDLPVVAKKNYPIIISLHDYWPICITTHFLNSDGKICNNPSSKNCWNCFSAIWCNYITSSQLSHKVLKKMLQAYGVNKVENRTACLRQSVKCADKLIVSSETIIEKFLANGFIDDKDLRDGKVALLCHGIETPTLAVVRKNSSNNIRFGYVGSFGERKGLLILIEAFNELGNVNAELKIYGNKRDLYSSKKYAKRLKEKSRNNSKITFMGAFEDVGEPYSSIDVLIVPSVTFEGYGLTVQEAFATKTPVIASNIGALNESVKHMKNGLLFEVGNSSDLARNMRKIVENPILLRQLSKNMPYVKSIEQNANEIEAIYKEVMHRARKMSLHQ